MMLPAHTYLAFGPDAAPRVVALCPWQIAVKAQAETLGFRRDTDAFELAVKAQLFGKGVTVALRADSADCMALIAAQYEGPWQAEVRGLAAQILLGRPVGRDAASPEASGAAIAPESAKASGNGGKRARNIKPVPMGPQPGGAAVALGGAR